MAMDSSADNQMTTALDYTMRYQKVAFPPAPASRPARTREDLLPYATGGNPGHHDCHEPVSEDPDLVVLENIETSLDEVQVDVDSFFHEWPAGTDWSILQELGYNDSCTNGTAVFTSGLSVSTISSTVTSTKQPQNGTTVQSKRNSVRKSDYEVHMRDEDTPTSSTPETTTSSQFGSQTNSSVSPPWLGTNVPRSTSDQVHSRGSRRRQSHPRPLLPRATTTSDLQTSPVPKPRTFESHRSTYVPKTTENDSEVVERRERNRVASMRFRERQRERLKSSSNQLEEYKARSRLLEDKVQALRAKLSFYQRLLMKSDLIEATDRL